MEISIRDVNAIESLGMQECKEKSSYRINRNVREIINNNRVSVYRPKSPSNRSKLSRYRPYQSQVYDSVRKTKSSALPASQQNTRDAVHSIGETASTPDLLDNGKNDTPYYDNQQKESYRNRMQRIHLNNDAIFYDNLKWACIFLNIVIFTLSLLYFGSALTYSFSRDILLSLMDAQVYSLMLVFFYCFALILWIVTLSGLYIVWKTPRQAGHHAGITLIVAVITVVFIFLQKSSQKRIENGVESHLLDSLDYDKSYSEESWNYFHQMFKCCGVIGFMDWCTIVNSTLSGSYLGTYECSVPNSCCTNYVEEDYEKNKHGSNETCVELLDSKKVRNFGCITFIKREIRYLGKTYNILTVCASVTLVLSSIASVALYKYIIK